MLLPYSGRDTIGTVSSSPGGDTGSLSGRRITAGYFYDFIQAEFSYSDSSYVNQTVADPSTGRESQARGDMKTYELKLGERFYVPGDLSYGFLYLGGRYFDFSSDFSATKSDGIGYQVGFNYFKGFPVKRGFEFVIDCGLFIGAYQKTGLSVNINADIHKTASISAGGEAGAGVRYEPLNLSLLLKFSPEYNMIRYEGTYENSEIKFSQQTRGYKLGFEIVYMLPDHRYTGERKK